MAIDRELEAACMRAGGWGRLYEDAIGAAGLTLGPANTRGERTCKSPFPFSDDGNPSFSVNEFSGLWRDWHAEAKIGLAGGNYVQFVALMSAPLSSDGSPRPEWSKTERELKLRMGVARPVDPLWLQQCQEAVDDEDAVRAFSGVKPWKTETLKKLGVGWDQSKRRFVLPVQDRDGTIANTRLYKVVRTDETVPKYLWSQPGITDNFLFPHSAWEEQWVLLVEGEGCAITLRGLGYNAASGTFGAGNPVPPGGWWLGKHVLVWMDADDAGVKAAEEATDVLSQGAASVAVCACPEWEGRPKGTDPSDLVMQRIREGLSEGEIQRELSDIMRTAVRVSSSASMYDAPPLQTNLRDALTSGNSGRRVRFNARVAAASAQKYSLPTLAQITCPATGQKWCKSCPMRTQHRGNARVSLDPRSPLSLKLVQTTDTQRDAAIIAVEKLPPLCSEPCVTVLKSIDVEVALLTTTLQDDSSESGEATRVRHEAFVIVPQGSSYDNNVEYSLTGFVYPLPRTQRLVFLVESGRRLSSRFDEFEPSGSAALLEEFRAAADPFDHVMDVAADLSASVTGIRGRPDLHAAYLVLWHSLLSFNMFGATTERGWVDMLVVGDTRCGKSKTFKKMADWYGTGLLVDCKMQTAAGLLGSCEQSMLTGDRYVVPGILPQNDALGPIALDEFSASKMSRSAMMDSMSSTRAEGMVRITKAASASFWARVRLAWLSNPGAHKMMRDIGGYGVELLPRLIEQPEDIARFDFAMSVSQDEVPDGELNPRDPRPPAPPRRSQEAAQALLMWAWSRKPSQVEWGPGAERAVTAVASAMCQKYSASVPLVEPADQRTRVGKVAVAVAVLCFSASDDLERVVVNVEHVAAAFRLFATWFDKPSFGYDAYSERERLRSSIVDPIEVDGVLDILFGANALRCAEEFVRFAEFNDKMLSILASSASSIIEVHAAMRSFSRNRCIEPHRLGIGRESYVLTRQFVAHLGKYIEKKRAEAVPVDNVPEKTNGTNTTTTVKTEQTVATN